MTFEQLLYVEVLSHYNSQQKAADVLHISKPGLSLAISELETELGVKLFERTSKGTEVTEVGLQLLSSISKILQFKSNLERLASFSRNNENRQEIRIQYINTMFKSFIEPFLAQFETKYSNVYYNISRSDTKSIITSVRNGQIDAGFIANSDIESEWIKDLIFKPVCHGKIVLGVSTNSDLIGKSITLDDLKKQRFCLYDDVYHEVLFNRLQYLCGPLNLILKSDDHWAISQTVTRLNAVCLGRSSQGILSRESSNNHIVSLDLGHIINDNTTLGWLINPRVDQLEITKDLINSISEEIKKEI